MITIPKLHVGVLAIAAALCAPVAAGAEVLVLGSVSGNIKKHIARFEPLAAYLAEELADDGITAVDIAVLTSSKEMITAMREERIQLFFDSPLVATGVADAAGGQPFMRRWKDGVASYHSVIIASQNSEIQTIEDLVDHRIGFQEPDSTSGFLLPVALLSRAELDVEQLRSRDSNPTAGTIGYVFTRDDKNTVSWLHRGWVDAAATDPSSFAELDAALPGQYRVIARSIEVPRQVVIRSAGLSAALQTRLAKIMAEMHLSENGRAALAQFNDTDRFDDFPDGMTETFDPIRAVLSELSALDLY